MLSLRKFLPLLFVLVAVVFTQPAEEIDLLLNKYFKEYKCLYYECFPVHLFPHFASGEIAPPLGDTERHYAPGLKNYTYYSFYDRDGFHFIFSSLAYCGDYQQYPITKTFTMFFYTTRDGTWVEEMNPIIVTMDRTKSGNYEPRSIPIKEYDCSCPPKPKVIKRTIVYSQPAVNFPLKVRFREWQLVP